MLKARLTNLKKQSTAGQARTTRVKATEGSRHIYWDEGVTNVECRKSFKCCSPYRAFSVSCPVCMKLTLHSETFIKHEDEDGHTPLMGAARVGQAEIVKMLIKAGCSPDSKNAYGRTAADLAAKSGHGSIVPLLKRYMRKDGVVPAPRRGPEGDVLHWHAWEDVAEANEYKKVEPSENARLAAKEARSAARGDMTREDAALDEAMEARQERVCLTVLAEQQNPALEALKHDMALGEEEEGEDRTAGAGWQRPEGMLTATASCIEDFLTVEQVQQHRLDDLREQGKTEHVQVHAMQSHLRHRLLHKAAENAGAVDAFKNNTYTNEDGIEWN